MEVLVDVVREVLVFVVVVAEVVVMEVLALVVVGVVVVDNVVVGKVVVVDPPSSSETTPAPHVEFPFSGLSSSHFSRTGLYFVPSAHSIRSSTKPCIQSTYPEQSSP